MVSKLAPKGRSLNPALEGNIKTVLLEVPAAWRQDPDPAVNPYYRLKVYAAEAALCEVGRAVPQSLQEQCLSQLLWMSTMPAVGSQAPTGNLQ